MPTQEEREDAAAQYGWSLALINSSPELKKAFRQAIDGGWSPQRFIAEIRDTDYFRKHAASWRENETLKVMDPATYKQRRTDQIAAARDAAAGMGAVMTENQLGRFADNVMSFGWSPAQQRDALATYVQAATGGPLKGQYIGDAGKNAQALQTAALRNGYKIPKGKLQEWNKAIMSGNSSVDDYQQFIRRQAAAAFPTFADELLAGADLEDVAAPYKNSMARLLEMPESKVTLFDPAIRKALASKDPKTGKAMATPIYDFEDSLRKDPRWMKTDNAHQEILGLGRSVLGLMGF